MRKIALINDASFECHHGSRLVRIGLDKLAGDAGYRIAPTIPVGTRSLTQETLEAVAGSSMVVVNGEGTLHGSSERVEFLLQLPNLLKSNHIERPIYLVNATLCDLTPRQTHLLRGYDQVIVRDSESLYAAPDGAIYVPDVSLYTLSSRFGHLRQVGDHDGPLVTDSVSPNLTTMLSDFAKSRDYRFIYLRSNLLNPISLGAEKWLRRTLGGMRDNLTGVRPTTDITTRSFLRSVAASSCMITGRFHAVCCALFFGKPFYFVRSNTPKIERMLADVGLDWQRLALDSTSLGGARCDGSVWGEDDRVKVRSFVDSAGLNIERHYRDLFSPDG